MYFKDTPTMYYIFDIAGKEEIRTVTDITLNARIRKEILENVTVYDEYDIIDGDTPEIIADRLYGSTYYHWVVMLVNEKFDYKQDFPLSTNEFEKYMADKYGSDIAGIHHYVNEDGYIVNSDTPGASPVTNYNYEDSLNESKRRIKVISKGSLDNLLNQYKAMF